MSFGLGTADGRPVATVTVHHCGPGEQAEQDLAELRAFGAPLDDSIARTRYLSVQQLHDEEEAWGHRFYMKSVFLPALPGELVDLAVEQISHVPPGADGGFSTWACGGAIATVPDDATAFTGRDASFWLAAEIEWDDPALDDACREWCRAAMSGMAPFESTGRYVNDVSEADERLTSIYGDAKADRLVALKREWDPDNVFRLNQNIRP
jgi:FAD/FMN-containing dehydrogenase